MSVDPQGPVLVEGPVEIVLDDGTVARSERFMVAICTCRRSRAYPWCDTSHRSRGKPSPGTTPDDQVSDAHTASPARATEQDRNRA
ncbi:CDGSH iron-sulfur domain-containing protein [Streptomyces sp. NPDC005195]|uniref:CDGSH iron-sulfur domain-containing protein n=1 Tax=Streptomyces sp. NPDC005195 TaxID=3154561 RepID=UPI0033B4823C